MTIIDTAQLTALFQRSNYFRDKLMRKQHWFSSIDKNLKAQSADQDLVSSGLDNFYNLKDNNTTKGIRSDLFFGSLRLFLRKRQVSKIFQFIISLDIILLIGVKSLYAYPFKLIYTIIKLSIFLVAVTLFCLLVIFILGITFTNPFRLKNEKICIDDFLFIDRAVSNHPLLLSEDLHRFTSVSSSLSEVNADKKVSLSVIVASIKSIPLMTDGFLLRFFQKVYYLVIYSPLCVLPNHFKNLVNIFLLMNACFNNKGIPLRLFSVMVRPNLGINLFCFLNNIENNFIYLSSTEVTVPIGRGKQGLITCLDFAYMGSDVIICDPVSAPWLLGQKNNTLKFEVVQSVSSYYVHKRQNKLRKLITHLKKNNLSVVGLFDASNGINGVISKKAHNDFLRFTNNIQTNVFEDKENIIWIIKLKKQPGKFTVIGYGVNSLIISQVEKAVSNPFDVFAIANLVISVPSSSIIFQAKQSGVDVIIFDWENENKNLRPMEDNFIRVPSISRLLEETKDYISQQI